jgi:hypothetical protein
MRSLFEMGFNDRWKRPVMGQFEIIGPIISAGLQAGAAVYGAHMQESIAKMQKRTQEDIANKQAQADQAAQQQQVQQQQIQRQIQAQQEAAAPKIMGIDQSTFIIGGVALALAVGVIAIVASKPSSPTGTVVAA